jgi:hypothetical protein
MLPAIGSAILFDIGASTGGTDITAMILKKYSSLDIGKALLCVDAAITVAACFVFGMETGLFSILGLAAKALMVDSFIESFHICKYFNIVTTKPDVICEFITRNLNRSATVLDAQGYYDGLIAENQRYLDWYAGMVQTMQDLNYVLEDSIVSATMNGLQAFTDMLFGLEDAGMEQILAAFIAPFGDTLKQMGSMIMAEGIAMEAFKKSFSNPYAAIAAGAALIAVGSAVSSGLQKLTANPAGGAGSASYGGASSSAAANNYESELTVNVVGHISGSDIALSLDRTRNKQRR